MAECLLECTSRRTLTFTVSSLAAAACRQSQEAVNIYQPISFISQPDVHSAARILSSQVKWAESGNEGGMVVFFTLLHLIKNTTPFTTTAKKHWFKKKYVHFAITVASVQVFSICFILQCVLSVTTFSSFLYSIIQYNQCGTAWKTLVCILLQNQVLWQHLRVLMLSIVSFRRGNGSSDSSVLLRNEKAGH